MLKTVSLLHFMSFLLVLLHSLCLQRLQGLTTSVPLKALLHYRWTPPMLTTMCPESQNPTTLKDLGTLFSSYHLALQEMWYPRKLDDMPPETGPS